MGINDANNIPLSDTAAAILRLDTAKSLSKLPSQLHEWCVGLTWERSSERSLMEYQMLDDAAASIDILKALNIKDRDDLQRKAHQKTEESNSGLLMAIKYRVCPIEKFTTRENMRELRQRRFCAPCVEDCIPEIQQNAHKWHCNRAPALIDLLQLMQHIMDKARSTTIQLQTDNRDGHWALELLNFYSDNWIVWLHEFCREMDTFGDFIDEDVERAKQRVRLADEIVREVEKEKWNCGNLMANGALL